jgi:hypothetical protein
MLYTVDKIQKDVRIALNLNTKSATHCLLNDGDVDTLMVDDLIRSRRYLRTQFSRVESWRHQAHLLESGQQLR